MKIIKKIYLFCILPYTLLVLYFMFIGFGRVPHENHIVRLVPIFSTIEFLNITRWQIGVINVLGNIIMFIPYGFLGWLSQRYIKFKLLITDFLSVLLIVELLQYFSRLGVFDIDDFILNILGVWIGFRIYQLIDRYPK